MLSARATAAAVVKRQVRARSLSVSLVLRCVAARRWEHVSSDIWSHNCSSCRTWSSFSNTSTRKYTGGPPILRLNDDSRNVVYLDGTEDLSDKANVHFAPQRLRQKVVSASDAVSLVRNGDTVCVSGFVCQGVPEAILEALGKRYEESGSPNNLTLLFGGGPGDWNYRGLNHLAKKKNDGKTPQMLRRTVGSHYGQVPMVAELALKEHLEAWTLPLGSVSRMIRAQSTHSPGHITHVGMGTYVDPDISGGAANNAALKSTFHKDLVTKITLEGQDTLVYKALPIDIAIIRGTTADGQGNITMEDESLLCDQKVMAAAARNSGGIVIAQVKRLAANGTLPSRDVAVPGPLVDCVVVVDEEEHDTLHPMSFEEISNPAFTGEIRTPKDEVVSMPLDVRKIIARRAFFALKPNTVVNLGIGLPEGVAAIAAEEDMIDFVTLSTEPGVFGGQPASGHSFGPSSNASALVEMNQMFDFYDGGGLDRCFLGAAQIGKNGDVNVSRMSKDRLTGPGGFIDISQSTKHIVFLSTLTTNGLEISVPGDGTLKIENEGKMKKFVPEVFETTFSGDEAVRLGHTVFYVTERAVFQRTSAHDTLELIEIAPGVDLQKDVLDAMDFVPEISPDLKLMNPRIFVDEKMNAKAELFGSLDESCVYHEPEHTMFVDLFGITIDSEDDIEWLEKGLREILEPLVRKRGKIDMVINYDGFDIRKGLEEQYSQMAAELEEDLYRSVRRFHGMAFRRAKLGKQLSLDEWDPKELYDEFDTNGDGVLSVKEIKDGLMRLFAIRLTQSHLGRLYDAAGLHDTEEQKGDLSIPRETFGKVLMDIFKSKY